MTSWPNWTDPQFLDAVGVGGMNAAEGTVSGSVASAGSGAWAVPGLLAPEAMTVGFSGLVATVGLPQPWGLIASSGAVVRAHGTQTGTDTTNYSVNFTSLVPASGSLTAYLAATITQIQQNSFPIPGPPPGDPAYNPNFVPTVGYATNQYSVALSAVSGGIDNLNTFELFRTTLTAGQVTITSYNTVGQVRAGNRKAWPVTVLASGGTLSAAQAQTVLLPSVSGLTHTLPVMVAAGGLEYRFINGTSGGWTIAASGTDSIVGFGSSGVTSIVVPPLGAIVGWCNAIAGTFNITGTSPNVTGQNKSQLLTSSGNFTVPPGVTNLKRVRLWGAGAGGGASDTAGAGSGGGGGGYSETINMAVTPGAVLPYVSGSGGAGGGGVSGGSNSGASSFNGMAITGAIGGTGIGSGGQVGGNGGVASGGTLNITGGLGQAGVAGTNNVGAAGGGSPAGGGGGNGSSGIAGNGTSPGGGGAGGGSGGSADGGNGVGGWLLIEW